MKAQVTLTPTESKKLIAKAIYDREDVQKALKHGRLAIHPSSSTVFLYEMITGKEPEGLWVCGVVTKKGLAGSSEAVKMIRSRGEGPKDPRKVSMETWFFKDGVLQERMSLGEILDQLEEGDVYVKGVNALDPYGNAGVLFSNPAGGGGTIGKVMVARKAKSFTVIFPAGYEKLIPVSIEEASKAIAFQRADYATGIPAALLPVKGTVITEKDAVESLFPVKATVIAAGGLGGGEGSVVMVIEGEAEPVEKAFRLVLGVKGAQHPVLNLPPEEGPCYPKLSI